MKTNPLNQLGSFGQAVWIDDIRRDLITSGELRRMIENDGLRGMTSNPAIFEKTIAESPEDCQEIQALALAGKSALEIYETLSQHDVQAAADEFRPVYEATDGRDGYVSLEVNPHLAHDANGTIQEARRLWGALNRPNILIKVPATIAGLSAIQQLIGQGINVNATLIFGRPRYRQVAEAYLAGIELRIAQAKPVKHVASVASFFLSRIDTLVDALLEKSAPNSPVLGQVAIASARLAYQDYKEIVASDRFQQLASQGVRTQRLLWASTSTKNPDDYDVKYIDELIGPDTVSTIPPKTLEAYRDHGKPESRIEHNVNQDNWILSQLPGLGIDIDLVAQQLETEGLEKFCQPFDKLMTTLVKKHRGQTRATASPRR